MAERPSEDEDQSDADSWAYSAHIEIPARLKAAPPTTASPRRRPSSRRAPKAIGAGKVIQGELERGI